MHELSIAYNLVEIAADAARGAGATQVTAVYLRLGGLAGVVPDALQFGFPIAAAGTLVEGAALIIEDVPVQVYCTACAAPRELESPYLMLCPVCGAPAFKLLQGRELEIRALEVNEAAPPEREMADAAAHP